MYAYFLVCNQAWVLLFGDNLQDAQIVDLDGQSYFSTREELTFALNSKGLLLNKDNTVTTTDNNESC